MNISLSIHNSFALLTQHKHKLHNHGPLSFPQSSPKPKTKSPSSLARKCTRSEVEKSEILMKNKNVPEEEEEMGWKEMGKWVEKCKDRKGEVEVMECLEREAIMGDDQGRDAVDYNRRAHIFDKSSRLFQALKENITQSIHE